MKRTLTLLLAMLLLFLGGCSGGDDTTPSPEDRLITVGISQVGAESDWRVANSESMKAVFTEENGYRLLFSDARQKQENQIIAIRQFIQQRVDYIVLMPLSETGWESVLQEARAAGIPVILVDRCIAVEDESLYTTHIGSDFALEGERAVEWMEKTYARAETVNIIHIQGTLGSTAQIGRTGALEAAVERHENWSILARFDGDFTQAKTYEVMNLYLERFANSLPIDVVYCENDNEAFGAIQALTEYGYVCGKDVQIITFDATKNALRRVARGEIALAVECNPLLGELVEEVISRLERGESVEKHIYVDEQCFTIDNVDGEVIAGREY